MDNAAFFVLAFTSLFTIINPFSTAMLFQSITTNSSRKKKTKMAFRASVACAAILIIFVIGGKSILSFFSITVDAFRIAGGVIITGIGLGMLRNKKRHLKTEEAKEEAEEKEDISLIPLAIPMLSGPGAIATAIVLSQQAGGGQQIAILISAIIVISALAFLILHESGRLTKLLGHNGVNVMERILGLIVLVVGIQFFINGIENIFLSWGLISL